MEGSSREMGGRGLSIGLRVENKAYLLRWAALA
jgi:hypothetical protein